MYSPKTRIEESGVRSSCETFETKSLFICESRICRATAPTASPTAPRSTTNAPPVHIMLLRKFVRRQLLGAGAEIAHAGAPVREDEAERLGDEVAPADGCAGSRSPTRRAIMLLFGGRRSLSAFVPMVVMAALRQVLDRASRR